LTWIGPLDGGFDEFDESCPSRASDAAIRRSKDSTIAGTDACTSGGVLDHNSRGIGGSSLIPSG
jgi:hypothetical protein